MDTLPQTDRRRQAYAVAKQIGLSREERHDLAEIILKRDCTSWNQISDSQMERMVDALNGFAYIHFMLSQRG